MTTCFCASAAPGAISSAAAAAIRESRPIIVPSSDPPGATVVDAPFRRQRRVGSGSVSVWIVTAGFPVDGILLALLPFLYAQHESMEEWAMAFVIGDVIPDRGGARHYRVEFKVGGKFVVTWPCQTE